MEHEYPKKRPNNVGIHVLNVRVKFIWTQSAPAQHQLYTAWFTAKSYVPTPWTGLDWIRKPCVCMSLLSVLIVPILLNHVSQYNKCTLIQTLQLVFHLNWIDKLDTFDDFPLFSTQNMTQKLTGLENILLFSQKFWRSIMISKFLFAYNLNITDRPNLI